MSQRELNVAQATFYDRYMHFDLQRKGWITLKVMRVEREEKFIISVFILNWYCGSWRFDTFYNKFLPMQDY